MSKNISVNSELSGESDIFQNAKMLQFTGSSAAQNIPTLHSKNQ